MSPRSLVVLSLVGVLALSLIYLINGLHVRHENIQGRLMAAWYLTLPGWNTVYSPEQTVDLQIWAGSKMLGITATIDGQENPEVEASIALKATGLYQDYDLEKQGGHWVLHKPASQRQYFSASAFYRISPFFVDKITQTS